MASLQFVRKVSGFRKPSKANQSAFDAAVVEVSEATTRLLEAIGALATGPEVSPTIKVDTAEI